MEIPALQCLGQTADQVLYSQYFFLVQKDSTEQ